MAAPRWGGSWTATRRCGAWSAGHVHQTIAASIAGRPVLSIPSTYVQARLDFNAAEIDLAPGEPRGFALHALVEPRDRLLRAHVPERIGKLAGGDQRLARHLGRLVDPHHLKQRRRDVGEHPA